MSEFPSYQPEVPSEKNEHESTPEARRQFGEAYRSIIEGATQGKLAEIKESLSLLPESQRQLLEGIYESMVNGLADNERVFRQQAFTSTTLLEQAFNDPTTEAIRADQDRHELLTLSSGLYGVAVNPHDFKTLYPHDAQAVAIKVKEGVSFMLLQRSENERFQRDNVVHEAQHLLWQYPIAAHSTNNAESDPVARKEFEYYRDELLATAVSGEYLHAYVPSQRTTNADGRLQQELLDIVIDLYDTIKDINSEIGNSSVEYSDLIQSFLEAGSFAEIRTTLQAALIEIQQAKGTSTPRESTDQNPWIV